MLKKKGFTLIELLAVIVILAIIALIAVPIVLQIIEDSKKSSQKESINMYGKAIENGVANYFLKNPKKKEVPELDELKKGGYINYKGNVDCKVKIYPNGKIYLEKCTVDGELAEYTYGEKIETLCTLDGEKTGTENINRGDKYKCEVIKEMEDPYTFYVLSVEGDKVNLIMDKNICNDGTVDYDNDPYNNYCRYAWHAGSNDNKYGPDTAMAELYAGTRNWNNVPNMNLTYNDILDQTNSGRSGDASYGYTGITITNGIGYITKKDGTTQTKIELVNNMLIKARLPKLKEITDAGCHLLRTGTDFGSCPTWLVENLYYFDVTEKRGYDKYSINNNNEAYQNIFGYWLLSSNFYFSDDALRVCSNGIVNGINTSNASLNGLRAVITVSKSDLS